ncbi:hypothetical protein [Parasitella parasitica]|uniref:Uncharacterized protein n=1 Tax=Parasitella parasitica TaxID=35722 RepID=A0A0B7NHB5_9FUNG|nr:hypothetical protein [Parasitella parasitica]
MNTHWKKLKFVLFPPTKLTSSNKTSIHPDYNCSTKQDINDYYTEEDAQQSRPSSSSSSVTKVNQEQKLSIHSQSTVRCSTLYIPKSCSTLIESLGHDDDAGNGLPLYMQHIISEDTDQNPAHHHTNNHGKKEIKSALKRCMLPFKIHYELEWPISTQGTQAAEKSCWLQLDTHTSNGIERVRKLGYTDLDVRLDDNLTRYINSTIAGGENNDNMIIQVLFDPNGPTDSPTDDRQEQLLRLRRVYWWSTSYNIARTFLPSQ